jgi:hypothetical protein
MNALNVMTVARNRWFQKGAVALGAILVGAAATLSLVVPMRVNMPVSQREPASALSAAHQRYEDFKQAQAEGAEAAVTSASPALSAARQRYEDFKLAQAEQIGAPAASVPPTSVQVANVQAARQRYEDFKLAQAERISTPAPSQSSALRDAFDRYETFKLRQIADL